VVTVVEDRATASRLLEALGLPADAPVEAPARDPTGEQTDLAFDVA
jgi:hypothetical protein